MENTYYVYVLRCEGDYLYTGITTDVDRRFEEHRNEKEKGAKYTRSHKPLRIERVWKTENRSLASKLEYAVKRLSKLDKEQLLQSPERFSAVFGETLPCERYFLVK